MSCDGVLQCAADTLLHSYSQDGALFLGDERIVFPPRRLFDDAQLLAELFWPKYFNVPELAHVANRSLLVAKLAELSVIFLKGMRPYVDSQEVAVDNLRRVLCKFGEVRERLKKDVHAAFTGDPASNSYVEIIRCYPGMLAIMVQRVAHELFTVGAKVYAREMMEQVHRFTGCDIHPGATIGEYFFIDHATGTVVGETAVIGDWCRLYQSVTIAALHFQETSDTMLKGCKRHPTIGNNCVIGSGAKLLGNITIGNNVSIGANSWVQEDVPDGTVVFIAQHPQQVLKQRKAPVGQPATVPDAASVLSDPRFAAGRLTPSGVARVVSVPIAPVPVSGRPRNLQPEEEFSDALFYYI